jgi:hypothetical protein
MADGKNVQLVWNDNRDVMPGKGMAVYSRRSSDMGKTWGPETPLTRAPEYTYFPSIYLTGAHADLVYGSREGKLYEIFHRHSANAGETWSERERMSKASGNGDLYPAIVRDRANVHLAWWSKEGISYRRSRDAGKSWEPAVFLTRSGAMPFLATAGDAVYVLFVSPRDGQPAIYFMSDPTGNKLTP